MPQQPDDGPERVEGANRSAARDRRTGSSASAARIAQQHTWVDLQVRQAVERGEFDDLPGAGKPIEGLGAEHDPDWWLKKLVEREQITVVPPAIALRKEDAELDARLDRLNTEAEVRREVTEFNERVRRVLYSNPGGPPVVTSPRDPDAEVDAWRERRTARLEAQRAAVRAARGDEGDEADGDRRGWRRRRRRRWG